MALRNVHKDEVNKVTLPVEATTEDRGLSLCGKPQLVVASLSDPISWKNDKTGIAYKFDSMTVELEDKLGNLTTAPGINVTFPYQSDAVGYCIDWRQVQTDGVLNEGCYRVKITWELAGNTDYFYYGSFLLRKYDPKTVLQTVRLYVVLNDLVRKKGINYKDSGFVNTVRFKGWFGDMQPNYETENLTYLSRIREKVRNEALRVFELRTDWLLYCKTRLIDEEHLLAANQIYVTDHNPDNHRQDFFDFPVIVNEEESPAYQYENPYAKIRATFREKTAEYESKYDGNIQGSANVALQLPTEIATCEPVTITDGDTVTEVAAGGSYTCSIISTAKPLKTNQTTSYRTGDDGDLEKGREVDFFTLESNNFFGNTNRFTDINGAQNYENGIVLDWSTYDGNEVLAYFIHPSISMSWNDAIDYGLSLQIDSIDTGWRLPNHPELKRLVNYQNTTPSQSLAYAPINLTNTYLWSSTTVASFTTLAWEVAPSGIDVFRNKGVSTVAKSIGARYINKSLLTGDYPHLNSYYSFKFDGSEYFSIPDDASLDITDNLSVACWVKYSAAQNMAFVSKYYTSVGARSWFLGCLNTGEIRAIVSSDGGSTNVKDYNTVSTFNDDNWHFIEMTFESGTLKIYVDSVEQSVTKVIDASISAIHSGTANVQIGAMQGVSSFDVIGNIDEVTIADTAVFSAGDSVTLYNGGEPTDITNYSGSANIVSHWKMGEGLIYSSGWGTMPDIIGTNDATAVNLEENDRTPFVPR